MEDLSLTHSRSLASGFPKDLEKVYTHKGRMTNRPQFLSLAQIGQLAYLEGVEGEKKGAQSLHNDSGVNTIKDLNRMYKHRVYHEE